MEIRVRKVFGTASSFLTLEIEQIHGVLCVQFELLPGHVD